MTVTARCLVESKYAEATLTTQYAAPTGTRVIIYECTVTPPTGATSSISMYVVPNAGTAGASNVVMQPKAMASTDPTYTCPEMVGRILEPGDFIATLGTVASSLVIRIEGRVIT